MKRIVLVLAALVGGYCVSTPINQSYADGQECKTVIECVNKMAQTVESLRNENSDLKKQIADLRDSLNALKDQNRENKDAIAALDQKFDSLKVTSNGVQAELPVERSEFWGPASVYKVSRTCQGQKSVLVGIDFDMQGINGVRTPIRVVYRCRDLQP